MAELENNTTTQDKKFVVAILLCLFLGAYGAHRFYVGEKKTAFIMLALGLVGFITFGLTSLVSAVWALYDLIQICLGNFKTVDGKDLVK